MWCLLARCLVSLSTRCRTGAGCFMKLSLHLCMILLVFNNALIIPSERVPAASNSRGPDTPPVRILDSIFNKSSDSIFIRVSGSRSVRNSDSRSIRDSDIFSKSSRFYVSIRFMTNRLQTAMHSICIDDNYCIVEIVRTSSTRDNDYEKFSKKVINRLNNLFE